MKALAPALLLILLAATPARAQEGKFGKLTSGIDYACDTFETGNLMDRLRVAGDDAAINHAIMDDITRGRHLSCRSFGKNQIVEILIVDEPSVCVRARDEKQRFRNEGLCYWLDRRSVDYGQADAFPMH